MDSEFKRMALTRKEAVKQWDTKLSRMNDSVEAYISECSVVLIPFLENAHFNDEFNGSCPDISIEDALLHINKKLDVLLSLESKLKHARAALQSYRNTSFTLAPINRLPVEILSYIVETGREQEEQEEREWKARFREEGYMGEAESWDANILNPEEVPQDLIEYIKKAQNKIRFDVLFSWVCNKWRCIAISITALWSKIDFRGRPPYDCAQEYIRRSKPSSLSVYFNSQRHKSSLSEPQNMDKALELISNNVDRVKSLVVEVTSTSELVKVLRTFCQASSPVPLESLQLARYNMIGRGISGGETAPRLGYIKQLMQGIRHIRLVNVNIPWDDVTHRSLSSLRLAHLSHHSNGPSINNLRSVIAGSPRLESLALEDVRISDKFIVNQVTPTPITLPFLHTLQLKQLSNGGDHFVLATLIAPNLVRLTLHDLPSQDLNSVLPDFVRGLQTIESGAVISSCRVEYLQLCNCKLESTVVEGMLASLPNLLEIYFHSMDCVTDSLFSSLIISDQEVTDSNACKKLQILRVVDCSHFTMAEVLKQAITSRQGMLQDSGVEELKRLDVKWCPMANEFENKEWFKQNVKTVFWKIDEQV